MAEDSTGGAFAAVTIALFVVNAVLQILWQRACDEAMPAPAREGWASDPSGDSGSASLSG